MLFRGGEGLYLSVTRKNQFQGNKTTHTKWKVLHTPPERGRKITAQDAENQRSCFLKGGKGELSGADRKKEGIFSGQKAFTLPVKGGDRPGSKQEKPKGAKQYNRKKKALYLIYLVRKRGRRRDCTGFRVKNLIASFERLR